MPIQDPVEMGMDLATLTTRLSQTNFYPELFSAAFGTPDVTSDRISKALAQFVRSMVSYQSKYDSIFDNNGMPDLGQLTNSELRGFQLFHSSSGSCAQCHTTTAQVSDDIHNIGLDLVDTDPGAGDGKFKSPSLRNSEVRGRFMHDGRFQTLEEVVEFYNSGIQPNANLDPVLVGFMGNFSPADSAGLVDFLKTLTDWNFLTDPKFADPFVFACDFDGDGDCGVDDLNMMLAEGPIAAGVPVDPSNARYDLNGDDLLDDSDLQQWLVEAALVDGYSTPYRRGDANLDSVVDGNDFIAWNQNKFTSSLAWDDGDFNGDGIVDGLDFIEWNGNKFTSLNRSVVPEPTFGLIGLVLMAAILSHRRARAAR
jgi:cytochrome c peroxidase